MGIRGGKALHHALVVATNEVLGFCFGTTRIALCM